MNMVGTCPRCGETVETLPCVACGFNGARRLGLAIWVLAAVLMVAEIVALVWVAFRDWGWLSPP